MLFFCGTNWGHEGSEPPALGNHWAPADTGNECLCENFQRGRRDSSGWQEMSTLAENPTTFCTSGTRYEFFSPPSEVLVHVVQLEDSVAGMLVKIKRAPPCLPPPPPLHPLPPHDRWGSSMLNKQTPFGGRGHQEAPQALEHAATTPSTGRRQAPLGLDKSR